MTNFYQYETGRLKVSIGNPNPMPIGVGVTATLSTAAAVFVMAVGPVYYTIAANSEIAPVFEFPFAGMSGEYVPRVIVFDALTEVTLFDGWGTDKAYVYAAGITIVSVTWI